MAMIEIIGDIWKIPAQVKCIPTNGTINRYGRAVMGAGVARQAKEKRKWITSELAWLLDHFGNRAHIIGPDTKLGCILVTFPTKYHFDQPSDLRLIERSAYQLADLTRVMGWEDILLPRPGCGFGGLHWQQVRPILEPILNDRFRIISREAD